MSNGAPARGPRRHRRRAPTTARSSPAWRPITSTTITRSWLSAVVCSRSIASTRDLHRGVEAEGHVGGRQVVVDRLRHADRRARRASRSELLRDPERVLAADCDQRVEPWSRQRGEYRLDPRRRPCTGSYARCRGSCRRGGSSPRVVATDSGMVSFSITPRQPCRNPDELMAELTLATPDQRPDHRVQARGSHHRRSARRFAWLLPTRRRWRAIQHHVARL